MSTRLRGAAAYFAGVLPAMFRTTLTAFIGALLLPAGIGVVDDRKKKWGIFATANSAIETNKVDIPIVCSGRIRDEQINQKR